MHCHWRTEDGERFMLPGCMGGAVYGMRGCTCVRPSRKQLEQRIEALEDRVKKLEVAIAAQK